MKLFDKVVAGLGALLLTCIVVAVGASLVRGALPLLVALLVAASLFRWFWQRQYGCLRDLFR